jgi:hypothetical protein
MTPDPVITLRYVDDEQTEGEKGLFGASRQAVTRTTTVTAGVLSANLSAFCEQMAGLVESAAMPPDKSSRFELESFEVTVEVSAGGEIRMIGSVSTEIKGGLKLIFGPRKKTDG